MSADLPKVRYLPGEQNQYVNYKVAHGSALSFEGWATEKRDGGGGGDAGAPYRENAPLCATALPAPPAPATLRQYQSDMVDRLRGAYRAGHRSPLLQLPTGGGKTQIFSECARVHGRVAGASWCSRIALNWSAKPRPSSAPLACLQCR